MQDTNPLDPFDPFDDFLNESDTNTKSLLINSSNSLSSIEIECLQKVSECIVEMRSIVRKNHEKQLSKSQLEFFHEALDACHNIPRVIAENHSLNEYGNTLDWLLKSNLESINTSLSTYRNAYYDIPELDEIKKTKISRIPYFVLGASVTTIVFSLIICFLYITDGFKPNYYKSNFEDLELPKYDVIYADPDPKYIEKEKEKEK